MSIQAVGWVMEASPSTGTARLVLLSLANHASREGKNAWPSVETIAHEARCSMRSVHYALRKLESEGHIERVGVSKHGVTIWNLVMEGVQVLHPHLVLRPDEVVEEGDVGVQSATPGGANGDPDVCRPLHTNQLQPSKEPVLQLRVQDATTEMTALAAELGLEAPEPSRVAQVVEDFPAVDHFAVVVQMREWIRDSAKRKVTDLVALFRKFCGNWKPLPKKEQARIDRERRNVHARGLLMADPGFFDHLRGGLTA